MKTGLAEKISKAWRIFVPLAFVLWLVPNTKAQVTQNVTAQMGMTRVKVSGPIAPAGENYFVSLPLQAAQVVIDIENSSAASTTYTLTFNSVVNEVVGTNSLSCVRGLATLDNNQITGQQSVFASTTTPAGTAANYYCAIPITRKLSIALSTVSGTGSISIYVICNVFPVSAQPTISAPSLTTAINEGGIISEKGPRWSINTAVGAGVQATVSKAAGATGVRHVADCMEADAGAATAPAATVLALVIRDGASGAGTILWQGNITAAATAAQHGQFTVCGLNLIGSSATAMTIEFTTGLTNEVEHASLSGYDVN